MISIRHCLFLILCIGSLSSATTVDNDPVKPVIKVLTYNIHHANPPSEPDSIDLNAIARVITDAHADLVALQEIDVFTQRSGPFNEVEELGRKTGLHAYFFKGIDYLGGEYGIGILSRFPVVGSHRYPLPTKEGTGGEPRVLGTVAVRMSDNRELLFACTHLDAQRDSVNRLLQIKEIVKVLGRSSLPVIIGGDFNATSASDVIRTLDSTFKRTCDRCPFTIPVDHPRRTIDFIAFTPEDKFVVREHRVIAEPYASDHLPVSAVLEVKWQ